MTPEIMRPLDLQFDAHSNGAKQSVATEIIGVFRTQSSISKLNRGGISIVFSNYQKSGFSNSKIIKK